MGYYIPSKDPLPLPKYVLPAFHLTVKLITPVFISGRDHAELERAPQLLYPNQQQKHDPGVALIGGPEITDDKCKVPVSFKPRVFTHVAHVLSTVERRITESDTCDK